jgi:hypothetical protein
MQFPITREALQTFDSKAAQEKKQKGQRYDFYRTLITDICKDIENGMMPFQILPQNSPDFIRHQAMLKDKQYIWKDIEILAYWKASINADSEIKRYGGPIECYKKGRLRNNYYKSSEDFNQALPEFIEILKETFIGCDIIVDPLKTYLIIDWS